MHILGEELLSEEEAAPVVKAKTTQQLAGWRYHGKGPAYVKIGRDVFYRPSDLRKYIESRVVRPGDAR